MELGDDHAAGASTSSSIPSIATPFPPSEQKILAYLQEYCRTRISKSPIYNFLLSNANIVHASRGLFISRLLLSSAHLNSSGGLHGSVTATIVDWAGGLAIAAWDCRDKTGVSVDINVSYVNSVREGDEIEIEGFAEKVGGSLAFTTVKIFKVEEGKRGKLVATGRHTKFVRQRQ
jgi:acyl-coenzyme A thioesterase 13